MRLRNLDQKIKGLLKQGLGPKELAWSISLGIVIGVFPIYGTKTLILAFLAFRFKLNLPVMIAVSYSITPLLFLLLIPFVRAGEFIFGFENFPLDLESIQAAFSDGILEGFSLFSGRLLLAVGAWTLVAIPATLGLYILLFHLFKGLKNNR